VTITLEDSGMAFDPRQQDMPTDEELAKPLEEREVGGLGIFLVIRGIDDFHYERVNNTNRNVFTMRRPGA
jgi:anti-sigma regulatory factor (Ser/Thr protein kinase)